VLGFPCLEELLDQLVVPEPAEQLPFYEDIDSLSGLRGYLFPRLSAYCEATHPAGEQSPLKADSIIAFWSRAIIISPSAVDSSAHMCEGSLSATEAFAGGITSLSFFRQNDYNSLNVLQLVSLGKCLAAKVT
jgi:hypothetical protein